MSTLSFVFVLVFYFVVFNLGTFAYLIRCIKLNWYYELEDDNEMTNKDLNESLYDADNR